ncbi:complement C3-like [Salarias fasciatus]|uniref:complement C3-like n=1 Tax=Salarias fasciatus TaxID=181472 RepID=UPI001176875F|nr:complement C3-like [Salarias fasciatus]
MRKTLLPLLASLAFVSLMTSADGAPLKVMSAPNLLRVETTENIFVECQDCTGGDIRVQINVMNHPTKIEVLDSTSVTLTRQNNYQMFGQVKISAATFSKDPRVKQHVYLQAQFDDQLLEKVVLVSFQSGHIFIQTDKTLYTPDSRVVYRMFAVTPQMEPVERDPRTRFENTIDIEIVTPDGIILPLGPVSLRSGIHSDSYQLPKIASPGLWKVVARFYNNQQQRFSADFEVKEYVLPSFEVKLKPQVPVFYVDSSDLTVEIRATYLLGEAVDGTGYVVFGLMQDGQKKGFPASIQRLPVQLGEGRAVLKREHITQTFPNIQELVGDSIFVSVSVLTENGTEMVEAEVGGIQIVTSPYTIHFKKTPRYFKPGMPFDLTVEVLNPDESPAGNVPVLVFPGEVQGVTASNGIARLFVNTEGNSQSLDIQARTNDPGLTPTRQAEAKMTAHSYASSSARFIHIGVDLVDIQIGNNLIVHLSLNSLPNREQDITYLIVSRGQLVKFKRFKTQGQVLIARNIPITKEILPSFRVVAYYHTDDEVVSDSVWVDAKDSCMGSLKLELERPAASYLPRRTLRLKVTGDPRATVGLVAVDKAVSVLNNKHWLTQKKVWDKVENHDTGCTPGGGKDSMGVFYDAGLLFVTNTGSETPHRLELKCAEPQAARRKRASPLMEGPTTLVDKYKSSEQQKDCCVDGMRETSPSYSCERRSEYIVDGPACVEAFLDCCREMTTQRADHQEDSLKLAHREEDDDSYVDNIDIFTRSSFPESWLWTDVDLPACPAGGPCKLTSVEKSFPLPDSFTTWQFTGISLSRTHGICVGEPLEVIVQKEFFIDLRLPYSAVRGELLEIKAILHNYSPDAITVRVDLMETQHVCSAAFKHGPYRQEVNVGPQTTLSVPFIIVPMREGEVQIEVKAAVKDSSLSDGIMKWLRVVPGGVLVRSSKIITLDPEGGIQEEILNSQIPRKDMIPHSIESTHIFITGREDVSALVESVVSGKQMGALIYQPSGPGEPNMIHMTYPVSATIYLDRTNQWEAVGFHKRDEALKYIKTGYYRELTYRKKDGSFVSWANRPSSSWLTAYVAKVFTMAHSLVAVQEEVICDAIKYLILNTQQPDGMFREVGTVLHAEMTGDVKGSDTEASMTAFKLIAMQESRPLCAATVNSLSGSIDKAVSYLERRLDSLTNPYAVAMTSYALANEGKLNREVLYSFVSPDLSHWPVPKGHQYTLEATAYALLALVKTRAFEDARPVVRWFTQQQFVGGGYGSTQATLMVYQALSEYWINAEKPEYHLNVDIFMPGKPKPYKFNVNRENHHLTRTLKSNGINHNMTVRATGSGAAIVKMVSVYYALPQEKQSDCQRFNMSVELIPEKMDVEEKVFQLRIEVLHNDKERDSTLTILDIGLLPGFTVDTDDLNLLSQGRAYTIAKYEMNTVLSERGSLIIYLDKVSHIRPEEISFRVRQTLKVGVLQPAAVSVYEYYNETKCVKLYHPDRRAGQPLWFCRGGECTCVAKGSCSLQKKGKISNDERSAKICEATLTNKTEFAYKVQLEETVADLSTDTYAMRILDVIKEGNTDVGPMGKLRSFLSHQHCRGAVGLQKGKTYLIMGSSQDIRRDDQEQTFWYMLDEKTWVEYWPTTEECQTDEHRPSCSGLEHMVDQFQVFSCRQ